MNLVPHGILFQVTVWLINFQYGFRLCSGGEPGYLDFDNLPETNFSCLGKVIGGYYADVETGCQMFHVCTIGQKDEIMDIKFLCLNGTVFDQETRVCERVDEVDCSKSERFYNLNLELYGNNAVTLSLHEVPDDEGESTEAIDDQHSTTPRPATTTTTTTTQRPTNPPSTAATTIYHQQNNGYSQHYQTPPYPTPQTSQSKSLYDDKNSGYHHQYIFHNGEQANNQATSFQLFSNQGVSSTTNQPQIHQARYGTTSAPQIILNSPSTVAPLFHGVSSTIQTLLNNNANNPSFINPLYQNHGIPSTTEHYTVHSNNPREAQEYHEEVEHTEERSRRPLEAIQSTNQGLVSKLSISPIPEDHDDDEESGELEDEEQSPTDQLKTSTGFLPTPTTPETTARSFYPTPRTSTTADVSPTQITRHIHLVPQPTIPQLKPQQMTINLPPPDIQRIVQNPSPLHPSQSRVIVTAKASVSDESGRPLNTSELLIVGPTIPASYDDYKEGDVSFDPFYKDVPKIRRPRSTLKADEDDARRTQALLRLKRAILEDESDYDDELDRDYEYPADDLEDEEIKPLFTSSEEALDIATIKANFKKFKALLLGRKASVEVSSEKKKSKEHSDGTKAKAKYEEMKDDSYARHEEETSQSEPENGQGLAASENSEDLNEKNVTKTVEDDVKPVTEKQGEVESTSDVPMNDDQPVSNSTESTLEQLDEHQLVPFEKEPIDESLHSVKDSEDQKSDPEPKSAPTTIESDAEEYIKHQSVQDTRESDLEEYIESKSAPIEKGTDVEEPVESEMKTKDSDSKDNDEPKSPVDTEEIDSHTVIKDSEEAVGTSTTEKILDHEVSSDSNAETESEPVPRVDLKSESTDDTDEKKATVTTTEKVASVTQVEMDQFHEKAHEKSMDMTKEEKLEGNMEPEEASDVQELKKEIIEPTTEKIDVEDAEKPEQVSGDVKEEAKAAVLEVQETVNATLKGSESKEETESKKLEQIKDADDTKSHQAAMKEEAKVGENSRDDAIDEKRDSLIEKVESVAELKDSVIEEESKKPTEPPAEEKKDTKLPHLDMQRKPTNSSGWKPSRTMMASQSQTKTENNDDTNDDGPASQLPKLDEAKVEPDSGSKTPEHVAKDEPKVPDEEHEMNDAPLPESKKKKEENSDTESETQRSGENSSESPNKIPSGLLDCGEGAQRDQPGTEDSRTEDDDYASEDYVSGSRESEPYESRSGETDSREPTSDYHDSRYDSRYESREDYRASQSGEDYVPLSGEDYEPYSMEDSRPTKSSEDYSTEGVLKFTDEIPETGHKKHSKQKNRAATKPEVSSKDYVDDNYEPDHYKENSSEKNVEASDEKGTKSPGEGRPNDEAVEDLTTTTTTTTTTTPRPTPPSLFRPVSVRKNYKYIPSTTTPNPVVIKHRFGLLNPRPAKPIKSYNDLAPKPVIRRNPLLARRPYGATSTPKSPVAQSRIDDTSDVIWTSTEYVDEDEKPKETKLTRSTNDVSINESDEYSGSEEEQDPLVSIDKVNLVEDSKTEENSASTEATSTITAATLSTPYPLLKSTTSRNLIAQEADEPQTLRPIQVQGSTESTNEGTTVNSVVEEKPLEVDEDQEEEAPVSQVPFNCIGKEPYRFYGDPRDCRLFHYCSPGFTDRQMLDFRFVCEDTTMFDEESQSCRYDIDNPKCAKRLW